MLHTKTGFRPSYRDARIAQTGADKHASTQRSRSLRTLLLCIAVRAQSLLQSAEDATAPRLDFLPGVGGQHPRPDSRLFSQDFSSLRLLHVSPSGSVHPEIGQASLQPSPSLTKVFAAAQASVASIPFIGKITIALQFLFVQRRGSADKNNKYTQAAGQTVEKLAERAADGRWAHGQNLEPQSHCHISGPRRNTAAQPYQLRTPGLPGTTGGPRLNRSVDPDLNTTPQFIPRLRHQGCRAFS